MNVSWIRRVLFAPKTALLLVATFGSALLSAQSTPDVLVLANGDTLHGKFVKEISGTVTFHSDMVGDVSVPWAKIKELHSSDKFAIIPKGVELQGKKKASQVPSGTVDVVDNSITVTGANVNAPIPVADATYIVDQATVDKLLHHSPSFTQGWNGAATAGASIVNASQNSYTVTAGVALVRQVPDVPWLNPRTRTAIDFNESYGKITQPAYTVPADPPTTTGPTLEPSVITKSSVMHADAERDWYIAPRAYVLALVAVDHNYAQDLDLQQIYGGGFGYTVIKQPKQQLDVKATVQYEKQSFSGTPATDTVPATPATTNNLVSSTFGASYLYHSKFFNFTQGVSFIPSWNQTDAWSFSETNLVSFPTYKNLSFSLGTLDTYLNDIPVAYPPTQNNSFQFTMGVSYAIKSKY